MDELRPDFYIPRIVDRRLDELQRYRASWDLVRHHVDDRAQKSSLPLDRFGSAGRAADPLGRGAHRHAADASAAAVRALYRTLRADLATLKTRT
ncbi:MAG: hypothetical protein OXF61_05340 [Acidimicrobiaceae bacterium]|nr:hypothetical protein [Acidimicrobiaceae bacterium]